MKPYIKIFYNYHKLTTSDFIHCAICEAEATDIHHISGKPIGNKSKRYDVPENLIPVCRSCHNDIHNEKISEQECKEALYLWVNTYGTKIEYNLINKFK
jgi:hypothetical protein